MLVTSFAPRRLSVFVLTLAFASSAFPEADAYRDRGVRVILEAYNRAYPDTIDDIVWADGDWTIGIGDDRFYWAEGRLLPAADRAAWSSYPPYAFYRYPPTVYGPVSYTPERIEALRIQGSAVVRKNGADNHDAFRAALYGGATRVTAERNLRKATFLGKPINVHELLVEPLKRIDKAVSEAAAASPELADELAQLGTISGYNWRDIRGTNRRSLHSWGLAVDIMPKKVGKRTIFWSWEKVWNADWMLVPLEKRWSPPAALITAFEREGFVWGGKWDFYDNMHFEYRPELAEIARLEQSVGGMDLQYFSGELSGEDND